MLWYLYSCALLSVSLSITDVCYLIKREEGCQGPQLKLVQGRLGGRLRWEKVDQRCFGLGGGTGTWNWVLELGTGTGPLDLGLEPNSNCTSLVERQWS